MRVIAGSARHLKLQTLDTFDTRPTTDRIKETLFNMIAPWIADSAFLDLFSGSGGIGIEALSRGARTAVFVENNLQAVQCIKENLLTTKLGDRAYVAARDVLGALRQLEGTQKFDYIFMDPPYHLQLEQQVLSYLSDSKLLDEDTVIIVEAARDTTFDYVESYGYTIIKTKEYKTNKHVFLEREGEKEIC